MFFHHFLYILPVQDIESAGGDTGDGRCPDIIVEQGHLAEEVTGFQPFLASSVEAFQDQQDAAPLSGKLIFYQDGLIFVDKKSFAYLIDFASVLNLNFYLDQAVWLEVKLRKEFYS